MSLELAHYSSRSITLDRSREYPQRTPGAYEKPVGFWVSVPGEDDWPTFCRNERFAAERFEFEHTVTLAADASVLLVPGPLEMSRFHNEYSVEPDEWTFIYGTRHGARPIDWRAVAADYDGIIIAPYQWSHRLELSWYYGWDCASGCIWNLDAIAAMTATPYDLFARETAVAS